jgi:hypothetical protein
VVNLSVAYTGLTLSTGIPDGRFLGIGPSKSDFTLRTPDSGIAMKLIGSVAYFSRDLTAFVTPSRSKPTSPDEEYGPSQKFCNMVLTHGLIVV